MVWKNHRVISLPGARNTSVTFLLKLRRVNANRRAMLPLQTFRKIDSAFQKIIV